MVNAPPTPPATTAAELQDAAQATEIIPEPSITSPIQVEAHLRPQSYQQSVQELDSAIARKDFQSLVTSAEKADIQISNDRQSTRLLIVAPLVLGHLIIGDIPAARYALQRLPENVASLPLTRALSGLVLYTMNRQHAQLYEHTNALNALVSQSDFFDKELGHQILNLCAIFLDSFRERTFDLLSKAYTSLPLSLACNYLCLPAEQIINGAGNLGWSYDSSTQILYPGRGSTRAPVGKTSLSSAILNDFRSSGY